MQRKFFCKKTQGIIRTQASPKSILIVRLCLKMVTTRFVLHIIMIFVSGDR